MCSVSAIFDYGRTQVPIQDWTRPAFNEFQEIIRRLEHLDELLAQPDCEDARKAQWMNEVEARLDALEVAERRP